MREVLCLLLLNADIAERLVLGIWTVLNCLIIKALKETRTYFACERVLSLNRMFLYAFAFKTRSQLKYEGVLSG